MNNYIQCEVKSGAKFTEERIWVWISYFYLSGETD